MDAPISLLLMKLLNNPLMLSTLGSYLLQKEIVVNVAN